MAPHEEIEADGWITLWPILKSTWDETVNELVPQDMLDKLDELED